MLGRAAPVTNGRAGKVRWIFNEPVLPSLQDYVVIDISKRDGVNAAIRSSCIRPRQRREVAISALPEVSIARAQVLRVTPYGATAIITAQEQPKIEEGTSARVAAKMP